MAPPWILAGPPPADHRVLLGNGTLGRLLLSAADLHILATVQPLAGEARATAQRETERAGLEVLALDQSDLRPST